LHQNALCITIDGEGRRLRTWVAATKAGRATFASELAALRELIAGVERSGRADRRG